MTTRRLLLGEPAAKIQEAISEGWQLVHIAHDEAHYREADDDSGGFLPEPRYIAVFELAGTEDTNQGIVEFLSTVNAAWLEDEILRRSPTPVGQSAIAALLQLAGGQMTERGEPAPDLPPLPQSPVPGMEDWPSPTAPAPTDTPLDPHADEEIARATGMDPSTVAPESVEANDPRWHSGKVDD
jgi:hypothetical protein